MHLRRFEDLAVRVLVARPPRSAGAGSIDPKSTGTSTLDLSEYHFDLAHPTLATPLEGAGATGEPTQPAHSALLVDLGNGDALFVAGAEVRVLPNTAGDDTLLGRAVLEAEEWRRKQLRVLRRAERADRFTVLSEELSRAATPQEACDAVAEHAARIVGAFRALLLLPLSSGDDFLAAAPDPGMPVRPAPVPLSAFHPASSPGLIREGDVAAGAPLAALAHLFDDLGARTLAYAPLEEHGVLVLVERRRERAFDPDDWYFLRAIASQVEAALRRIALRAEVAALALDDPLTGASSRRRFDLLLEHSVAAARRGVPLSLLALRPTALSDVAEHEGPAAVDRELRRLAGLLAARTRATDTVARVEGDEFLVLLPGCDAAGAQRALARLREMEAEELPFEAVVACFDPTTMTTGADLLDAARAERGGDLAIPA